MSTAVIKPKPGTYNGVKYRSQLEIAWAKWLDAHRGDFRLGYVDERAWDFVLESSSGLQIRIEVKPAVASACLSALERVGFDDFHSGDRWILLIGNPPSCYGKAMFIDFTFCTCSHIVTPSQSDAIMAGFGLVNDHGCDLWSCLKPHLYFDHYPIQIVLSSLEWERDDICGRRSAAEGIINSLQAEVWQDA